MTGAALSRHEAFALAAAQLGGQDVVVLRLMLRRRFLCPLHARLHPVVQILRDDRGDAVGNGDLAEGVFSDISAVVQHPRGCR